MGLILDTCILIEAERKKNAIDFSIWAHHGAAYISTITVSELLLGVHHADTKARQLKRSVFVEGILSHIPALDFTTETARIHAEIYAHLAKKGKVIGAHDLIIAATALAHDCSLLTMNQNEFNRVPGLTVLTL